MPEDLSNWTPRPKPERRAFEGRYVRLEPLNAAKHTDGLYQSSNVQDGDEKFRYLPELPPSDRGEFLNWVERVAQSRDPLFFACIDRRTGEVAGRQTLMRFDASNGVIEVGNIYWGPLMARRPAATEALFLFMEYVFDGLGYRRFEWKCNNDNAPSKRAALRFGFTAEGVFRKHMIVKGLNRDTAWFSIIDSDWPALREAYHAWLDPSNFDAAGGQIRSLSEVIDAARKPSDS